MSRVRTHGAELAVRAGSRSALPRGSGTAPGRAKGLEENGVGPSGGGGGGGEVFSNIEVRVKRAGPSGLGDLEVTEYIARIIIVFPVYTSGTRHDAHAYS